eukprot:Gb_10264 [translate_table: standard]
MDFIMKVMFLTVASAYPKSAFKKASLAEINAIKPQRYQYKGGFVLFQMGSYWLIPRPNDSSESDNLPVNQWTFLEAAGNRAKLFYSQLILVAVLGLTVNPYGKVSSRSMSLSEAENQPCMADMVDGDENVNFSKMFSNPFGAMPLMFHPFHSNHQVFGCKEKFCLDTHAFHDLGFQVHPKTSITNEEQVDPFTLVADELAMLANRLRSMIVTEGKERT